MRSLLEARNLLLQGIRWRIGNGVTINAWDEPWVPRPYSFKVLPVLKEQMPNLKVSELIDFDSGIWNMQLINSLFLKPDVEEIVKIPLSPWWPQDEIVWHFTKDGNFTVKSAYQLAVELRLQEKSTGSSSTNRLESSFWNAMWKLEVPPRVKMFLWKACNGILATKQNIHKRIKSSSKNCTRCGCSMETDKHIFFECQEAREVWKIIGNQYLPRKGNICNFKDWLAEIINTRQQHEVEKLVVTLWLLWKSRNEDIFEGAERGAMNICHYGTTFLQDYKALHAKREASNNYHSHEGSDSKWKPPTDGLLKLNVDGAFANGMGGIGVVIRNSAGEVEAMMTENLPHCYNAEQAETIAFLRAVQFAKETDITHLIIEGDALTVVNKIQNNQADLSMVGHIIDGIKALVKSFPHVEIVHVSRLCNMTAHQAAKLAMTLTGNHVWFSNFPSPVMMAAKLDLN